MPRMVVPPTGPYLQLPADHGCEGRGMRSEESDGRKGPQGCERDGDPHVRGPRRSLEAAAAWISPDLAGHVAIDPVPGCRR